MAAPPLVGLKCAPAGLQSGAFEGIAAGWPNHSRARLASIRHPARPEAGPGNMRPAPSKQ